MNDYRNQLLTTFRNQHLFSRDYSLLYASLFHAVAGWLEEEPNDPVSAWLLEASNGRRPLDISILLAAGLHRDVLLRVPELSSLAQYYPSVEGPLTAGQAVGNDWNIDLEFKRILKLSILARRESLQTFIQTRQVQTNETGRGISWLLPVSLSGWAAVHLLDLGASAGLNLVAEKRNYQFLDHAGEQVYLRLGEGDPVQFEIRSNDIPEFPSVASGKRPHILSRLGCDITPFFMHTPFDELTLTAFVWGDQTVRLDRLQEGIAAYRRVERSPAPVELHTVDLPAELPDFLARHIREDVEPLICYNTYIRMYMPQKGAALRHHLTNWARQQKRPVIWIQWEPPSSFNKRYGKAPKYGWLAWTIDLWFRGQEQHYHIGWVHPHGQKVYWLPGLQDWIRKTNRWPGS